MRRTKSAGRKSRFLRISPFTRMSCGGFLILLTMWVTLSRAESDPAGRKVYQLQDTLRVTGERLLPDPTRVPMAVTSITLKPGSEGRGLGLDEALQFVPGLIAQSRAGGSDVRIVNRGFGARGAGERSNAGTTRGIRITLDGYPLTEPDGRTSLDLVDLEGLQRITVIRSNTSALFGSAAGGVIELVSRAFSGSPFVEARVAGGSFGLRRFGTGANLPLGDDRVYLNVTQAVSDGWRIHSGSERTSVEAAVHAQPGENTHLGVSLQGVHNFSRLPGALTLGEMNTDPQRADSNFVKRDERRNNRLLRLSARLQHNRSSDDWWQIGAFVEPKKLMRSERGKFRDFQRVHAGTSLDYHRELNLSHGRPLRFVLGADEAYQDGSILFYTLTPAGGRGTTVTDNKREGIHNAGLYGEIDWPFFSIWDLALGGRLDLIQYISEDYSDPLSDARMTLTRGSPRVSLSCQPTPSQSLYLAIFGGLEAPAFNEIDPPPAPPAPAPAPPPTSLNPFLKPTRSLTAEIGNKGLLGDRATWRHLRYDLTFYWIDLRDDIVPWNDGAYYFMAGKSRRYGAELGAGWETAMGLSARLACALSNNKYLEYRNNLGKFDGNFTAGVVPRVITASVQYETRLGPYVSLQARHLGPYFADDANTTQIPAYMLLDGAIGARWNFGGTRWDLHCGAQNLLDKSYVGSVFVNGVNGRFYEPGLARNFTLALTVGQDRSRE